MTGYDPASNEQKRARENVDVLSYHDSQVTANCTRRLRLYGEACRKTVA